ncbi:unnamed protein product [Caenorhabditis bovis]|uniref:Uncharacterized protein n=1 Tax=Caenorhabditis bovis TaxID=2654633 RepID=A0A8S1F9Y4_9PELO|nr:unnamed protein product [Caenorhabditis bovis]
MKLIDAFFWMFVRSLVDVRETRKLCVRVRDPPKNLAATNPSKRHRERLNGELETVAMLLPYDSATISRLDKLSVLRLAVSFLQCKAHFQACIHNANYLSGYPITTHSYLYNPSPATPFSNKVPTVFDLRIGTPMFDHEESDFEDIALKALGGFILVLNDNGEIYYASENIEQFLGFHQSDVLHQPVYDLIHSEDREDIRQQLDANIHVPPTSSNAHFDVFAPQNSKYLTRNVNARFRCLLDNTCGFLRIDMTGKLFSLHGLPPSYVMGRTNAGPVLGMICICTPFVPPSTTEIASEDMILKTKHQLDGSLVSMDPKVYEMLEITDADLPMKLYNLIHVEDAVCMAEAHKEVIKNGSSGLLIYRLISLKSRRIYFVQSSCRLFYKNGKPESIGLTYRLLNEVEGTMLLEKRSSLKAKLLSFDDTFLQSPRNLQSTAALPLPPVVKDEEDLSLPTTCLPSASTFIPPSIRPANPTTKIKKKKEELPIPPLVQPSNFEMFPMFSAAAIPPEFPPYPQWPPPEAYPNNHYNTNGYYHHQPHNIPHMGMPMTHEMPPLEYIWNNSEHIPPHPSQHVPDHRMHFPMNFESPKAGFSTPFGFGEHPKHDGFNIISEVTSLLGG